MQLSNQNECVPLSGDLLSVQYHSTQHRLHLCASDHALPCLLSALPCWCRFPRRLYYRERLFPHHSFAITTATGTGDGTLSLRSAGRAFSGTFALSCCIFEARFYTQQWNDIDPRRTVLSIVFLSYFLRVYSVTVVVVQHWFPTPRQLRSKIWKYKSGRCGQ